MTPRLVTAAAVMTLLGAACAGATGETSPTSSSSPNTAPGVQPIEPGPDVQPPIVVEPGQVPPEVDLTIHSVPLDEVYFDTFDGGSVPLSVSTPELRSRLLDAIPPIDRPVYGPASDGSWLAPDDLVLGYVTGGRAYAYPFKILNYHEIVNDELDGVPVLISYCPLCRSAIVYDRRAGGHVLSFGNTSALYESDLVMVDRNTGSYWWQVAGTAIVGPLTGTELVALPSEVATWAGWTSRYPDTLVLSRETGYERPYERDAFATYADVLDAGRFPFPVGEAARDPRLAASALVVGVVLGGDARVYPIDGLTDPINDEVGGEPVVVFPTDGGATVYRAVHDGRTMVFQRRGSAYVDAGTGSVWAADGAAVSGPLAGEQLQAIPTRTAFWFAFVGAFPDARIWSG